MANKNTDLSNEGESRRSFIKSTASAAILLATGLGPGEVRVPDEARVTAGAQVSPAEMPATADDRPWYKTVTRWGQVNITEKDPAGYDIPWWREYWKDTATRGIIVNAGGIVAYYPTQVPLHRRAEYLSGRDLFGELCHAAHADGIAVFARMDSSK